jgi:hypothetical protein
LLRQKVYLFLKDLVHTRADLAAQRVAIHRYVVDRVGDTVRQSFFSYGCVGCSVQKSGEATAEDQDEQQH